MKLSLTSNAPQYRDALIDWMAYFRANARDALKYQGRLLGDRLVKFTPPRTAAQGRKRVDKDIRHVILGLDHMAAFEEAQAVLKGDTNIVRAFVTKAGVVYGVDKALYKPDATLDEISKFHQSQRGARGRVTTAGARTRDIGRWKFLTQLVVPKDRLEEYISLVEGRVGRGKGGWAQGVISLGGSVPGWIEVHARTAGRFVDRLDDFDPSIEFINASEWARGGDEDRIMDNAIASRIRDIQASILRAKREASKKAKIFS